MFDKTISVVLIIIFATILTGCTGGNNTAGDDGGTGDAGDTSADECTDGATRCAGTWIEECVGGEWTQKENCADTGQLCSVEEGEAVCYGGGDGDTDTDTD
ncbi:MAG: hypothetical protein GY842_22775, partial [bacterium]|nr:hypothetical protein [bacterium]